MKKTHRSWFLGTIGLLIVLGLMAGCYRPAAPDVTPTLAGGAEAVSPEEETPDIAATAIANTTLAAQVTEEGEVSPTEAPTEAPTEPPPTETQPPATALPTLVPTTPPTTPAPTQTPPPTGEVTHVVQQGENLFRIALRYGTTVQAIANANGIANPALVCAGQVLTIPSSSGSEPPSLPAGETTYVVQRGDNLFRIALRYNLSYMYLAQYNGIANPANIYVGQVIRIP